MTVFTFRYSLTYAAESSNSTMTQRLQDMPDTGRPLNLFRATTGGPTCRAMSVNTARHGICVFAERHKSANHLANFIRSKYPKNDGMS